MRDHMTEIVLGVIGAALVVLIVVGIQQWTVKHAAWVDDCTSKGGHVIEDSKTNTGTGIDPSTGKPVVVTSSSTTYYCLSDDGRILGIEGAS